MFEYLNFPRKYGLNIQDHEGQSVVFLQFEIGAKYNGDGGECRAHFAANPCPALPYPNRVLEMALAVGRGEGREVGTGVLRHEAQLGGHVGPRGGLRIVACDNPQIFKNGATVGNARLGQEAGLTGRIPHRHRPRCPAHRWEGGGGPWRGPRVPGAAAQGGGRGPFGGGGGCSGEICDPGDGCAVCLWTGGRVTVA